MKNLHLKNLNHQNNPYSRKLKIIDILKNEYNSNLDELIELYKQEFPNIFKTLIEFRYDHCMVHPLDELTNFTLYIQKLSKIININIDEILYKQLIKYQEYEQFVKYRSNNNNNFYFDKNHQLELSAKIYNDTRKLISTILAEYYIENIMGYRKIKYKIKKDELSDDKINHYMNYVYYNYKDITSENKINPKSKDTVVGYSSDAVIFEDILVDILESYTD